MAGVTAEQIYQTLLSAGASTMQAIGIMANMINESSLDPEAKGDGGTSFGLVQDHGAYSFLVTGNPVADMQAQVKNMVARGGLQAASGSTPQQVAGNFAANYERCVGCQSGGAQYNQRVGNASTVAQWAATGAWPQASAGGTTAAQQASAEAQLAAQSPGAPQNCAWQLFGGINLPLIGNVGSICVLTNTQARALIGGLVLTGGVLIAGVGVSLVAVAAGLAVASKAITMVLPVGRAAGAVGRVAGKQAASRAAAAPASEVALAA